MKILSSNIIIEYHDNKLSNSTSKKRETKFVSFIKYDPIDPIGKAILVLKLGYFYLFAFGIVS